MALDKGQILEMLQGMGPNYRDQLVNSIIEGTSPDERERIIDRTKTKMISPYTSEEHRDLLTSAFGEDENLANSLASWLKKPANLEWFQSSFKGGAEPTSDLAVGDFDTFEEEEPSLLGFIKRIGRMAMENPEAIANAIGSMGGGGLIDLLGGTPSPDMEMGGPAGGLIGQLGGPSVSPELPISMTGVRG